MIRTTTAATATLAALLALGGCQTARLGGVAPAGIPGPGATYNEPILEEIPPAPSGAVTSEPLAPLPGTGPVLVETPTIPAPEPMPQRAAVSPPTMAERPDGEVYLYQSGGAVAARLNS